VKAGGELLPSETRTDASANYFAGRTASQLDAYLCSRPSEERSMREFGVRRYGDTLYHHCMADSAADAANWFAHFQTGIEGKNFQALVKDVARPVSDEVGIGGNPEVVVVRHGPLTPGGQAAIDLKRTSSLR
jgi:broad specificity phosphatase PhoE